MRTLLALAAAVLLVIAPAAVRAQTAAEPSAPALEAPQTAQALPSLPASEPTLFGLSPGQAVTVGVGVAVGALAMDILVGGAPGVVVGALAGALIGTWWYDSYGPTLEPLKKAVPGGA